MKQNDCVSQNLTSNILDMNSVYKQTDTQRGTLVFISKSLYKEARNPTLKSFVKYLKRRKENLIRQH